MTDLLYQDDFAAAKKQAELLASAYPKSTLAEPAGDVANATDIATAREAFKKLSAAAIELVGKDSAYTVMHCPMVKGGGGDWLSADGKVNNPHLAADLSKLDFWLL